MVLHDIYLDLEKVESELTNMQEFITLLKDYEHEFIFNGSSSLDVFVSYMGDDGSEKVKLYNTLTRNVYNAFGLILGKFSKSIVRTAMQLERLKNLSLISETVKRDIFDFVDNSVKFLECLPSNYNNYNDFFKQLKLSHVTFFRVNGIYTSIIGQIRNIQILIDETSEKIPEEIINNEIYKPLTLRSSKKTDGIDAISEDLSDISDILKYAEIITKSGNSRYRINKIESGTLYVALLAALPTIQLVNIIVKMALENWQSYLNIQEHKGDIILKKLAVIKELKEVAGIEDSDLFDDPEIMEKLVLSVLKYIGHNPKGKINDIEYDVEERKLLEMASQEDN